MYIETTFRQYGHGKTSITGIATDSDSLKNSKTTHKKGPRLELMQITQTQWNFAENLKCVYTLSTRSTPRGYSYECGYWKKCSTIS